jgi:hypothetical protein
MGFYDNMAKTADRLITQKGQEIYLFKESPRAYDKNAGTTAVTSKKYKCRGVILNLSARDKENSLVQAGDMRLLLSALDENGNNIVTPEGEDMIRDANLKMYALKEVVPVSPAGTVVFYDCLISGAG